MREHFTLSAPELVDLESIGDLRVDDRPAAAQAFWARAALVRGADPASVIGESGHFTALPLGHGKHWCYPAPLRCARPPVTI